MPTHAPKGPIKRRESGVAVLEAELAPQEALRPYGAKTQCTAKSKTSQQQCRQPAIAGGTVCKYHGGAAPQVIASAQDRLLRMQFPAIDALQELLDGKDFPSTRYQAVRDILDRTMGKPTETVKQEHSGALVIRHETADE